MSETEALLVEFEDELAEDQDLLYWVDRLRAPFTDHVWQPEHVDDDGVLHGGRVGSIRREGLLAQLREAVTGSIGSHEGSAGFDSSRLPFNAAARELYDSIEGQISTLFVDLTGKPVYLYPERTLTEWYLVVADRIRKGEVSASAEALYVGMVRSWVLTVEGFFDPPKMREYDKSACPRCGEEFAFDSRSGDRVRALVMFYREPNGDRELQVVGAECRFCGWSWRGRSGVRELMRWIARVEGDEELADRVVAGVSPVCDNLATHEFRMSENGPGS